jgi:hypothetical protein
MRWFRRAGYVWRKRACALLMLAIWVCASTHADGPTDHEAKVFLQQWLTDHGYDSPQLIVSEAGIPPRAAAATVCRKLVCVIRIRPGALRSDTAERNALGSSWHQWQNLLLHEAIHYIDIRQRGRSDHGREFRMKTRSFGVAYAPS